MKQSLQVEITIPDDLVVISKVEYLDLLDEQLTGRTWNMKQLEERTNRSGLWLRKNVLEVPEFRRELEGFVLFPKKQGQPWKFGALKMNKWLEENQELIFGR